MHEKVTLGAHEVDVYAQRHAYLTNKLAGFFQELTAADVDATNAADVVTLLGDRTYDLLGVVLPQYTKRCPKYEFAGYGSQEAYEHGDYVEELDKSPSFPEMVNAFEVAAQVNRFDVLKVLGKVFDANMLKTWVNSQIADAILTSSASLPATSDGSPGSTSSGAKSPTSTENEGSPSDGSPPSLRPVSDGE
jgi:hypothetical protein